MDTHFGFFDRLCISALSFISYIPCSLEKLAGAVEFKAWSRILLVFAGVVWLFERTLKYRIAKHFIRSEYSDVHIINFLEIHAADIHCSDYKELLVTSPYKGHSGCATLCRT